MTDTVITVQGSFVGRYPAERALVRASVQVDGAKREAVFATATASAEVLRESIAELHDPRVGPVTWWSADSVRVSAQRPWSADGAQLPLVHTASLDASVRFSDFDALSRWIERVALLDGLTISGIEWRLTTARETTVTAEVRSRAVRDAVDKATIYAQSIGLGTVRAVALADPGMLGDQGSGAAPGLRMAKFDMAMASSGGGELVLRPQEIEVAASVDARFIAS